jgi:hypothetical protein
MIFDWALLTGTLDNTDVNTPVRESSITCGNMRKLVIGLSKKFVMTI